MQHTRIAAAAYALGGPEHYVAIIVSGVAITAINKGQRGL